MDKVNENENKNIIHKGKHLAFLLRHDIEFRNV